MRISKNVLGAFGSEVAMPPNGCKEATSTDQKIRVETKVLPAKYRGGGVPDDFRVMTDREVLREMEVTAGCSMFLIEEVWARVTRPTDILEPLFALLAFALLSPVAIALDAAATLSYPFRLLYGHARLWIFGEEE